MNDPDGSRYTTDQSLSDRIKALALLMVEQNKNYPPVLESVAQMVVAIRDLDHVTALNALTMLWNQLNSPKRRRYVEFSLMLRRWFSVVMDHVLEGGTQHN